MAYEDEEYNPVGIVDDEEQARKRASILGFPEKPTSITSEDETDKALTPQGRQPVPIQNQESQTKIPTKSITGETSLTPQAPAQSITSGPPMGPAAQRESDLLKQGRPKYHGAARFFDTLANITGPGAGIEARTGLGSTGYETRLGRAAEAAKHEGALAEAPLKQAYETARTGEQEAKATQEKAKAEALAHPAPKLENLAQEYADSVVDAIRRGVDPAKDQKVMQLQDAITSIQKQPAARPDTQTQEDQRYEQIKTNASLKKPISPEDTAWAQAYEKRKTLGPYANAAAQAPQKSTERSDKSYTLQSGRLDKDQKPVSDRLEKINTALTNLEQKTPFADSLLAPEILSVMAGGQGSGLRMNEAEISRIVGGRSNWEGIKAAMNQWKLDPTKALSVTEEQRKEMAAVLTAARDKLTKKHQIIEDAQEHLLDSDDPKEHRRIVGEAKKGIDSIDAGEVSGATPPEKKENAGKAGGAAGAAPPKKGDVVDGYEFLGGNPADKKSWKKH